MKFDVKFLVVRLRATLMMAAIISGNLYLHAMEQGKRGELSWTPSVNMQVRIVWQNGSTSSASIDVPIKRLDISPVSPLNVNQGITSLVSIEDIEYFIKNILRQKLGSDFLIAIRTAQAEKEAQLQTQRTGNVWIAPALKGYEDANSFFRDPFFIVSAAQLAGQSAGGRGESVNRVQFVVPVRVTRKNIQGKEEKFVQPIVVYPRVNETGYNIKDILEQVRIFFTQTQSRSNNVGWGYFGSSELYSTSNLGFEYLPSNKIYNMEDWSLERTGDDLSIQNIQKRSPVVIRVRY